SPFYRFGDIMWLERIAIGHWTDFIVQRFKSTGKSIDPELAKALASSMGRHSWYVQQLAHFTWNLTKRKARPEALERGIQLVLDSNRPLYQLMCETLSTTAINVLKAIGSGETQLTAQEVLHVYKLG